MNSKRKDRQKFSFWIVGQVGLICILSAPTLFAQSQKAACKYESLVDEVPPLSDRFRRRLVDEIVEPKLRHLSEATTATRLVSDDQTKEEIDASTVRVLEWAEKNGGMDFLLAKAEAGADFPHLKTLAETQAAYNALSKNHPYAAMQLVARYGDDLVATPAESLRRHARTILRTAPERLRDPTREFDRKLQIAGALATLFRSGVKGDAKVLNDGYPWAEEFPTTTALVNQRLQQRLTANGSAEPTTLRESLEFTRALVKDVSAKNPEFALHVDHFGRVARHVVQLEAAYRKKAGLPEMTAAQKEEVFLSIALHDVGKLFWPDDLIAKKQRIGTTAFKDTKLALRRAEDQRLLSPSERIKAEAILETLNAEITEDGLKAPTEQQVQMVRKLAAKNILSEEEARLLLTPDIQLSQAERDMASRHFKGYQTLSLLNPDNLAVAVAQNHHNFLDGSGYPFNLKSKSLSGSEPASAALDSERITRLTTLADILDAVISPRPNSPGKRSAEVGLNVLRKHFEGKVDAEGLALLEDLVQSAQLEPHATELNPFNTQSSWEDLLVGQAR